MGDNLNDATTEEWGKNHEKSTRGREWKRGIRFLNKPDWMFETFFPCFVQWDNTTPNSNPYNAAQTGNTKLMTTPILAVNVMKPRNQSVAEQLESLHFVGV